MWSAGLAGGEVVRPRADNCGGEGRWHAQAPNALREDPRRSGYCRCVTEYRHEPPGLPDQTEPLPLPTDPDAADPEDRDPEVDVVPSGTDDPAEDPDDSGHG